VDLRSRKVIVTGGVRGLGRAMVQQLSNKEAVVTVFDLNRAGFDELKKECPRVHCVECDVSVYEQVVKATTEYHEHFGPADVLINNAGILHSEPLIKITSEGVVKHDPVMWNKVLAADLSSVFFMSSCVVEKMITTRKAGLIVNISSVTATGSAGASAYSAAKAGVNALTAAWAKELGPMGIRVVAIGPGFMETESTKEAMSEAAMRDTVKNVPLKRLGKPDEIARAVLFVIENDFFNGKVLPLDGGLSV
jgi:3-oxoacyl-[acyl-carrier protein] reductase